MGVPKVQIGTPTFGEPTLISHGNGDAVWARGLQSSATHQKSGTGWTAKLYGGIQTSWDDWAAVYIPVNDIHLRDLTSALWTWYNTEAEAFGVNMVIWIHDPNDNDKRAEMTQQADISTLEKAAGWDAHELNTTTDQFYFYGEGTTGTGLTSAATSRYGLNDYIADAIFKDWRIYRISLEWGFHSGSAEFKDVWVADIKLNNVVIPLKPDTSGSGRIGCRFTTAAAAIATALSPKTPFRLLNYVLHLNAAATQETLTITCDAGRGSTYDTKLYSKAMAGVQDIALTFGEGYDFKASDEIDVAWTNTDTKTYGTTVTYQTVFEGC